LFNIPTSDEPYDVVELNPYVILNILDHHLRRDTTLDRVIGALLGRKNEREVQVKYCFPVPHKDEQEIAVDMDFYRGMLKLHNEVHPLDVIVGWYSTGLRDSSVLLHNFFMKEIGASPVHIVVDPTIKERMDIHCYYGAPIELGNFIQNMQIFKPLKFNYTANIQEKVLLETHFQGRDNTPVPVKNLSSIAHLIQELLDMINNVQDYVQSVISGDREGSYTIGSIIEEVLSLLPTDETEFNKIFSSGMQDLLMVTYLSNLSKKHLKMAEQLRETLKGEITSVNDVTHN
jgi:translation initiation factor 3 subunit F